MCEFKIMVARTEVATPNKDQHKTWFFPEKDLKKNQIDYKAAIAGNLQLIATGSAKADLKDDYMRVTEDNVLIEKAENFEALLDRCARLESRANSNERISAFANISPSQPID
jgi:hypothetical protein